jgi:hypothetical protein
MEDSTEVRPGPAVKNCNPVLTLGGRVSQELTISTLVAAAAGSGLYFGWDSLAALGLTTLIVSLALCVLMCAVGVCASRMGRN